MEEPVVVDVNVMSWDASADRVYEYGVSKGVIYTKDTSGAYTNAEAWNGLINISDNPTGADVTKLWADGIEYAAMRAAEEYEGSIEAYTYPDLFAACNGFEEPITGMSIGQQNREMFGLCWRTEIGNADDHTAGYKLHLAYGLTASPSEQSHDTVNDSPDADTMSWDMSGVPVNVTGYKPTCKVVIDSTKFSDEKMAAIEKALYGEAADAEAGTSGSDAYLPTPDQVKAILAATT